MTYVDWGYAGRVATVVLIVGGLAVWVGAWLAVTTVRWETLAKLDERDRRDAWRQSDAPDWHDVMPALQPERIARHRAEMAELDEHAAERFVG